MHARTRKEMSKVPAHWERIKRAVEIRNETGSATLILGNGDAFSLEDARAKAEATGADGIMLGRAIFGNPWLFHPEKDLSNVTLEERFSVLTEHTKLFEELLPHKSFALMKKHYKAYINGFDGAKELRAELMDMDTAAQIEEHLQQFLKTRL
jgi:tRNA-dihydrouridine synthase